MAIRIDEINVERAGPIAELQLVLKQFNLIYGHNEQGKTFLVEFVIRSLFKNLSGWSLRYSEGQGNVVVSGLVADSTVTLRPSSGVKLEELLMDKQPGLPPRISKLLVVKGADLSFDDEVKSGVRRDDLKDFLSGQGILDIIEKNISKTVRKSTVESDQITGPLQGEIKKRNSAASDLKQIDGFFEQIEALYSGGERQALQSSIDELSTKIGNQEAAKRHRAYEVSQSIREQLDQLERLPQADLDALKADYNKYQESENRLDRQEVKLDDLTQRSQGYEWLEEAISIYEKRGTRERERVSPMYPIVIVLALILAVASSFIGYPLGTVLLILVAVVFGGLVVRQYRTALEQAVASEEINKIDSEFENRFGQPLSGLPDLKEKKKSMEAAYFGLETVREEQKEERAKLEDNEDRMRMGFMNLVEKSLDREDWESELKELTSQRDQLERQLNSTRLKLAALDIPESEFQEAPAADEYSKESLEGFKLEFGQLEERLRIENGKS